MSEGSLGRRAELRVASRYPWKERLTALLGGRSILHAIRIGRQMEICAWISARSMPQQEHSWFPTRVGEGAETARKELAMTTPPEAFRYDSYCGLYCGACSVMIAAQEGQVERLAAEWHASAEDVECHGCKSDQTAKHCRTCKLKACARERGVAFCSECSDYPCPQLEAFKLDGYPPHLVGVCNLAVIRQEGVEAWLREQEKRWQCPRCQKRFEYYQAACPQCGQELRDSRVEATELRDRLGLKVQLRDV
jgi:hypothetical protein